MKEICCHLKVTNLLLEARYHLSISLFFSTNTKANKKCQELWRQWNFTLLMSKEISLSQLQILAEDKKSLVQKQLHANTFEPHLRNELRQNRKTVCEQISGVLNCWIYYLSCLDILVRKWIYPLPWSKPYLISKAVF